MKLNGNTNNNPSKIISGTISSINFNPVSTINILGNDLHSDTSLITIMINLSFDN